MVFFFGTDTAAANTLNDYEEGTWTVNLSAADGGSLTATQNSGYYTKVGNIVTAWFNQLTWTSQNLSGASLKMTGLPFALADTRSVASLGVSSADSFTSINGLNVAGDAGDSTLWLMNVSATNNNYAHMAASNVASTGNWYGISITYRTA